MCISLAILTQEEWHGRQLIGKALMDVTGLRYKARCQVLLSRKLASYIYVTHVTS